MQQNKDLFYRGAIKLKSQIKGLLEANNIYKKRIRVVATVKSKKEKTRKTKYSFSILLKSNNIKTVNKMIGNTIQRDTYKLEYKIFIEIKIFQ